MGIKKQLVFGSSVVVGLALAWGVALAGEKMLSKDELINLIKGKTVTVVVKSNGKQWKMYFSPDGKSIRDNGDEGEWEVNDKGQHCNTGVKLKCAAVADLGGGTYARKKPNGDIAVTWTKIEDGKKL